MKMNRAYRAHLASQAWRSFCLKVKTRDEHRCVTCNADANETRLEVHHRTYDRLGQERLSDCYTLCRDCHRLITCKIRRARHFQKVHPPLDVATTILVSGQGFIWKTTKTLPPLEVAATTGPSGGSFLWTHQSKDTIRETDCQVSPSWNKFSQAAQWTTHRPAQPLVESLTRSNRQTIKDRC
jgi:hypothetical protein